MIAEDKLAELNMEQNLGRVHPYTCGHCRTKYGTRFQIPILSTSFPPSKPEKCSLAEDLKEGYQLHLEEWNLVATKDGWLCPTCGHTQPITNIN